MIKEAIKSPRVITILTKATPNLYFEEISKFSQIISWGYPKF